MSSDDTPEAPPPAAANLTAPRFEPGKSGNPGGRPKDLPRFRATCREKTWAWLEHLEAKMADPDVSLSEKTAAWKAVADRGGYLPAGTLASIEATHARLLLLAMALKKMTKEQRQGLIDSLQRELFKEDEPGGDSG